MYTIDPNIIIFCIIFLICSLITTILCKKIETKFNIIYYLLMEIYILVLIKVVIMPIYILNSANKIEFYRHVSKTIIYKIQYIPLKTIYENLTSATLGGLFQFVGNIVLLMPAAFFIWWVLKEKNIGVIIICGILLSIGIEFVQYLINTLTMYPSHAVDIDDTILNSIGYCAVVALLVIAKNSNNKIYAKVKERIFTDNDL